MNFATNTQSREAPYADFETAPVERRVLRRLAGMLEGGVSAGQLAHDVAGPLSTLVCNLEFLDELLPDVASRSTVALEMSREASVDMRGAVSSLREMCIEAMARLRDGGAPEPTTIDALLDGAERVSATLLSGHARAVPTVIRRCEPARVRVTSLHARAIGNLLVNGALHQERRHPLVVEGRVEGGCYRLRVRDHGISAARREARIDEIRSSVSFIAEGGLTRSATYRGHGMGLMLARALVVSTGGDLRFEAPESGDGLIVTLDLPLDGVRANGVG